MEDLRLAFAGDRDIAVQVLDFILSQRAHPIALLLPGADRASHTTELVSQCAYLESEFIFRGQEFCLPESIARLKSLNIDYLISVHFPYIVPQAVLSVPRFGVLNLHPAYLPYNRGWHTPSWALLQETPIGATLHFMDTGVDTGDILHQKRLDILASDTAHTLYQRLKDLEFEVFREAWPKLLSHSYQRRPQDPTHGTSHRRQELFSRDIQCIDLDEFTRTGDFIRRLRALTTNISKEAAYFEIDGKRYYIQVTIHDERELDQ